ncbi:hypothetical protein GWI33_012049 [Rhynchophorus ferrugineus]|uniref:Uncharacterized protein n=1 Tax=Rhynchophorus ferrugineus TaxID=354439 RepID=A0A834IA39_RHYFE|nr:hypothetical protein GWI33_012049 [Rhynchophorus ferrugineus]
MLVIDRPSLISRYITTVTVITTSVPRPVTFQSTRRLLALGERFFPNYPRFSHETPRKFSSFVSDLALRSFSAKTFRFHAIPGELRQTVFVITDGYSPTSPSSPPLSLSRRHCFRDFAEPTLSGTRPIVSPFPFSARRRYRSQYQAGCVPAVSGIPKTESLRDDGLV